MVEHPHHGHGSSRVRRGRVDNRLRGLDLRLPLFLRVLVDEESVHGSGTVQTYPPRVRLRHEKGVQKGGGGADREGGFAVLILFFVLLAPQHPRVRLSLEDVRQQKFHRCTCDFGHSSSIQKRTQECVVPGRLTVRWGICGLLYARSLVLDSEC